jgi:purine-nucleoside phosphorylase
MRRSLSVLAACVAASLLVALVGCAAPAAEKKGQVSGAQASAAQASGAQTASEQTYRERLESCANQIRAISDFKPEIVVVLGTGLGSFVDDLDVRATIPYADIEGWPASTAPEHAGNLVFAEYHGHRLAVMQGRIHYYEGYSMEEVVLPMRVLHMLGANTAILTNAVGSMNPEFRVGEFVCVRDQISSFIPSPLIGQNIDELGDRFVGMTGAFDQELQDTVLRVGGEKGIPVHSGVYIEVTGPQYETPAEIEMYRSLGADTVAMSMADEVLAARHMGMRVCAINCISNMAAGMEEEGFSEETIGESMKQTAQNLRTLLDGLVSSLSA